MYEEMRIRQQEEFNALPIGFAFSEDQFRKMMKGWGLDPQHDLDKIYKIPGGGYIQKKDRETVLETMNRFDIELREHIAADTTGNGFIYEMFLSELKYHEYGYTGDVEESLGALGLTEEDVKNDPRLAAGLEKAKNMFWD